MLYSEMNVHSAETLGLLLSEWFRRLEESGIDYLVLRNYEQLPESTSGDVDILVAESQLFEAEALLYITGNSLGWRVHHRAEFSPVSIFLSRFDGSESVHIDLFKDLVWRGADILPAATVLARKRRYRNFYVPDPVDEAVLNLLTRLLYAGYIKDKYKPQIIQTIQSDPEAFVERLSECFNGRTARLLSEQAGGENWKLIEKSVWRLRIHILSQTIKRHPLLFFKRWLKDTKRFLNRLWSPAGLMLVLIGPDGSGKSTIAQLIKQDLDRTFPIDKGVHCHWKPCFLPRRSKHTETTWIQNPHGRPPRSVFSSIPIFLYHWFDFVLGYFFKYYPALFRNGLVLVERHYYDFYVDQKRYLLNVPIWLVKLCHKFVPSPDLVILFDAPPEVLWQRKQEISLGELQRQTSEFRTLITQLPQGIILDCTPQLDTVRKNLKFIVLEYLSYRTRKRWPFINDVVYVPNHLDWIKNIITNTPNAVCVLNHPFGASANSKRENLPVEHLDFIVLPSFSQPKLLVPIKPRRAALVTLHLYNPRRVKGILLKQSLKLALTSGLTAHLPLPKVQFIFSKEAQPNDLLHQKVKDIIGRDDLSIGMYTGTNTVHKKPVLSIVTKKGELVAIGKIGLDPETVALVQNEGATLQELSHTPLADHMIPKLLYASPWGEKYILLLTPPKGKLQRAPNDLSTIHVNFLKELINQGCYTTSLCKSEYWNTLLTRINTLITTENLPFWPAVWNSCLKLIQEKLGNTELSFARAHGDFVPWNTYLVNDKLYVFDWEYSRCGMIVGWDIFHFYTQTNILVKRANAYRILAQAYPTIGYHLLRFQPNCPPSDFYYLYALYLVDVSSWYIFRDKHIVDLQGYRLRKTWLKMLQTHLESLPRQYSLGNGLSPSVK